MMNRSHSSKKIVNSPSSTELSRKVAIHEAGHAAAIHLGNRQKQLPPIFFQLCIEQQFNNSTVAKIDGGRLIHTLPSSLAEATADFSSSQQHAYQQAFEADIINLLVGPLAEAYYVALRDNEPINSRLITINALSNYGGFSDLTIAYEYLRCFSSDALQQQQKMSELFLVAFHFVKQYTNWRAITALAEYILATDQEAFDYVEIVSVLDADNATISLPN
jgi:hypothetical protein